MSNEDTIQVSQYCRIGGIFTAAYMLLYLIFYHAAPTPCNRQLINRKKYYAYYGNHVSVVHAIISTTLSNYQTRPIQAHPLRV